MSYRLECNEPIAEGVRRIAGEQLSKAVDELRDDDLYQHEAVHQVRKRFKKIRGLVRLVRPAIEEQYAEINEKYRDLGRQFSELRDAESLRGTLVELRDRFQDPLDERAFSDWESRLIERRQHLSNEGEPLDVKLNSLADELDQASEETADWPMTSIEPDDVFDGLRKTYRRGRKAFQSLGDTPSDEELHEWRKRTKYHWYHLRLIRDAWKPVLAERVDQAHQLSNLLGDDHDLAVLTQFIEKERTKSADEAEGELLLRSAIQPLRRHLQHAAFRLGRRIYAEKPKSLIRRLSCYWEVWSNSKPADPSPLQFASSG